MIRVLSLLFSGVFGGPHNNVSRIAPVLAHRGVQFLVAIPDEPGNASERLRAAGLQVVRVHTHRLRRTLRPSAHLGFVAGFWRDVLGIQRIIREHQIDVIVIHGAMHPQGAIAGQRERIAVVWQIIEDLPAPLKYILTPLMMRCADVLMTTGMTVAQSYPGIKRLGNRLIPFFPPVDPAVFRPDGVHKAAARHELGLPPHSLVIGTVGNINPDKDHRNFIRAAAMVKRQCPEAKFVILGATYKDHSAYCAGLWREAQMLGLTIGQDLVIANPEDAVARLAQAFDIFWLTSRAEGVPAVVGEAMAMGREAVREGKTGYVVPARNPQAIAAATQPLLSDPGLRARLGRSGRRFAQQHFDVSVCAAVYLLAFQTALARRHRPQPNSASASTHTSAVN
jgi:glycosyltransferase involved in cell wall biosynthesis